MGSSSSTPLGLYLPGDTFIHRVDPRCKLLVLVGYIAALFCAGTWYGLLVCVAALVAAYLAAHLPLSSMLRGLRPLAVILIFLLVVNSFSLSVTSDAIASIDLMPLFGCLGFRPTGALHGLYLLIRVLALIAAISLLTYTTSIVLLSDALSSLLRPLSRLGVPTDDAASMLSIVLRFVPLCDQEARRITTAQRARGACFDSKGPLGRLRAWTPVLIPLFVSLFRRADRLSCAMESRCYTGHARTHLHSLTLRPCECLASCILTAVLVSLGIML